VRHRLGDRTTNAKWGYKLQSEGERALHPAGAFVKEWEQKCVEDFEQGMSYDDLARKYGNRHPTTIRKMLKVHGAIRKAAPASKGGPKRLSDLKPLSRVHQAIGIELNRF
jgi:hypothetical protein